MNWLDRIRPAKRSGVIGIDASRAFSDQRTGTETYSFELLRALAALDPPDQFELYLNARSRPANLPHLGAPILMPAPRLWTHRRLSQRMLLHPPGLLFVPSHVVPFVHPPAVVTIHDLGFLERPDDHPPRDRRQLDLSTRWSVRAASRIITVSQFTRSELERRYNVERNRIEAIPLGVADRFRTATETDAKRVRERYRLPDRFVLFTGTVQPRKNFGGLARAIAEIARDDPSIQLVIAGKPGWLVDRVDAEIAASGAAGHVIQLGYVPGADLPGLYRAASVFCLPSHYEGFGLPALEAMAAGVPVVVSDRTSLPEIVGDAGLLVDPDDPRAIARAVRRVWSDRELAGGLSERGRSRSLEFTWKRTAIRTLDVLRAARDAASDRV